MDWSTGSGLDRWLDEATRGIRFGPDRRAISEMGNATELGKELARIHKPWLGWLWAVSCVFLWAAGIMLTFGMLVLWRLI